MYVLIWGFILKKTKKEEFKPMIVCNDLGSGDIPYNNHVLITGDHHSIDTCGLFDKATLPSYNTCHNHKGRRIFYVFTTLILSLYKIYKQLLHICNI
jgi:hypothetical protein